MAGQRELSFDEPRGIDYFTRVLMLVNEGKYSKARDVLRVADTSPENKRGIIRTIAIKTGVYL